MLLVCCQVLMCALQHCIDSKNASALTCTSNHILRHVQACLITLITISSGSCARFSGQEAHWPYEAEVITLDDLPKVVPHSVQNMLHS
jgi:hypothetical protein